MPSIEEFQPGVRFRYGSAEYTVIRYDPDERRAYLEGGNFLSAILATEVTILTPIKREPLGFAKFIRQIEGEPNVQSSSIPASSSSGDEQCEGDECVPQQRRTQHTPEARPTGITFQSDRWMDDQRALDSLTSAAERFREYALSEVGMFSYEYQPSHFSTESFLGDQRREQQEAVPLCPSSQRRRHRTTDS